MYPTETTFNSAAATQRAISDAKPRILIAEDSQDSREMMQMLLRTKGYEVVVANDGLHALEVATQALPDLVLIDLQLPKLDGLSVTKNLRLNPELKNIPIIILSGHDPSKYRQAALEAGYTDYLLKPLDFDRLDKVLQDILAVAMMRG